MSKSINVPIINDGVQDITPFYFTVGLSSPNPAGILGAQTVASVDILDVQTFNQPPAASMPR